MHLKYRTLCGTELCAEVPYSLWHWTVRWSTVQSVALNCALSTVQSVALNYALNSTWTESNVTFCMWSLSSQSYTADLEKTYTDILKIGAYRCQSGIPVNQQTNDPFVLAFACTLNNTGRRLFHPYTIRSCCCRGLNVVARTLTTNLLPPPPTHPKNRSDTF
jgi:hypothetical protein